MSIIKKVLKTYKYNETRFNNIFAFNIENDIIGIYLSNELICIVFFIFSEQNLKMGAVCWGKNWTKLVWLYLLEEEKLPTSPFLHLSSKVSCVNVLIWIMIILQSNEKLNEIGPLFNLINTTCYYFGTKCTFLSVLLFLGKTVDLPNQI